MGKKLQKRSKVIPNPIFISGSIQNLKYKALPKTIVYLGRLDNHQKRLDVLLDSFKEFYESHCDYRLIIYGRGRHCPILKIISKNILCRIV